MAKAICLRIFSHNPCLIHKFIGKLLAYLKNFDELCI